MTNYEAKTSLCKIYSMIDSPSSISTERKLFLLLSQNLPLYKLINSINIYRNNVQGTVYNSKQGRRDMILREIIF